MKKKIEFKSPIALGKIRDATDYLFPYDIVDSTFVGRPEEKNRTSHFDIKVGGTRSLLACWGLNEPDLIKVLFEYGKRHVVQKIKDGTLLEKEELLLSTSTAEVPCPFDPSRIRNPSGTTVEVDIGGVSFMKDQALPSQIVKYIDTQYPQVKKQLSGRGEQFYLGRTHAPKVKLVLSMVENIPPNLLKFDDDSQTEFDEAISAIQCAIDAWNAGENQYQLRKIPNRQKMHPFTILRKHLIMLKDEESIIREEKEDMVESALNTPDRRKVFVVHGRNNKLRSDFFSFLRALGLQPIEWSEALKLTRKATPYIGEALEGAFKNAQAVIVLLSPDDEVRLSPKLWKDKEDEDEKEIRLQARPNVLFEAGMAFGTDPDRTLLIEVGEVKKFSDMAGRHVVRLSNSSDRRNEIAERLKNAGCDVSKSGSDWLSTGNFNFIIDKQNDPFGHTQTDLNAYYEAYKDFTKCLNNAIARYRGYSDKLSSERKYTEVGVREMINEVSKARMQLLLVCGKHVRSYLEKLGTEWLNDMESFFKTALPIVQELPDIASKDRV